MKLEIGNIKNCEFFYLIPTIGWGRFNGESLRKHLRRLLSGNRQPSGGVQIIYQHCDILNRNGLRAFPVNLEGRFNSFKADWFDHKTQPISVREARKIMVEEDVVICPEIIPEAVAGFPARRNVLFVQNWALVKEAGFESFTNILTVSPFCEGFMQKRVDQPISVVTNGINTGLFKPVLQKRILRKVLFWGRKNREDGLRAITLLPEEARVGTCFVEAPNGLTQAEIADYYQQADIFISLGYPEGFALPPLEAMACGCAVIGFTGGGGNVHMIDGETALVAEDGNIEQLAVILTKALADRKLRDKIRAGGLQKAREFGFKRMKQELLDFARIF